MSNFERISIEQSDEETIVKPDNSASLLPIPSKKLDTLIIPTNGLSEIRLTTLKFYNLLSKGSHKMHFTILPTVSKIVILIYKLSDFDFFERLSVYAPKHLELEMRCFLYRWFVKLSKFFNQIVYYKIRNNEWNINYQAFSYLLYII